MIYKRILCLLLLACLLLSAGCKRSSGENGELFTPTPFALPSGSLVQKQDLQTLLVMGMAYDSDNISYASTLTLVVLDKRAQTLSLLSVPKDTRVLLSSYDEQGSELPEFYGPVSRAYYLAEAQGLGEENTLSHVQALLGGVPLQHYAMLNIVQLRQLNSLCGGVTADVDAAFASIANISPGQQLLGRNLETYATHSYLVSQEGRPLPGTDAQKIGRHQRLVIAFLRALSSSLDGSDDPDALSREIHSILRTSLDPGALSAFIHDAAYVADKGDVYYELLPGADSSIGEETYYIADSIAIKDWAISLFYEETP